MPYWAHFEAGRLSGAEFYCVRAGSRRQSVRTSMAGSKFQPQTDLPHGKVKARFAPIYKSRVRYLHGHVFGLD
jgi:hypothetical protein